MLNNVIRRLKYRVLYNNPLVWFKKCFLARRILKATPLPIPSVAEFEIHVHTCSRDFVGLLWALRSFYFYSGNIASLTVHDDGTLKDWHFQTINRLFPGSRAISKIQSDEEVGKFLASFPNCQQLRKRDLFSMKVFDFPYYSRERRLILMDSDVLFFGRPHELITPCRESLFNADMWTSYIYSTAQIKDRFGLTIPEKVNAGLGAINKECFDFELMERVLADDGLRLATGVDQTLIAMLGSRNVIKLLGPEYRISLSRGLDSTISKHYVRLVRHLFFLEGLPRLAMAGIIK